MSSLRISTDSQDIQPGQLQIICDKTDFGSIAGSSQTNFKFIVVRIWLIRVEDTLDMKLEILPGQSEPGFRQDLISVCVQFSPQ